MSNVKKVLVSGARGFVGQAVVERLSAKKQLSVTALTRKKERDLRAGVTYVVGDLLKPKSIETELLNADIYVHLASEIDINGSLTEPRARLDRSTDMLLNVLEVLRTHKKKPLIIFTSTDRLYGATLKKTVTETEPPVPIEPYTAGKILCEIILETYSRLYGIPYMILRLSSVYGPRQPRTMFISDVIHKMAESDSITVGNVSTWKNFVYVDDVAGAIDKAIGAPVKARNTVYNIGGAPIPMRSILGKLKTIIEDRKGTTITVTSRPDDRPPAIEVKQFKLSTKKAEQGLGWQPKVTFDEGLKNTVNYFLTT